MHVFDELRRRNVFRMAGLYLVGAWLLVQVASTLFPAFDVPGWTLRALVIVLALGFVPALVFAWLFELTPDGLKRDGDVAPGESIAPQTARRMDRMIIAVLLLALIVFAFDRLVLAPRRDAALVASTTQRIAAAVPAASGVGRNSIAVLPFVNMSGEAANEYFSDGISEEILNVLAGTPQLQVAARTSSFAFKGKAMEVPAIARELKVRMVLEGSVRKQGDKVRITAQLIDADTGFHVWSQTYDRKLEDIFAIQDEIARAIGDELKIKIAAAGAASARTGHARNVEAYDLYLQGMALWHQRRGASILQAIDRFRKAIAIDPDFAQAYGGLGLAYSVVPAYTDAIPTAEALALSDDAALHALALDPGNPEAYAALGNTAVSKLQRGTAVALLQRATMLRPSFATAYQWRGSILMSNGELDAGYQSIVRASTLDPRSVVIGENLAWSLMTLGRNDEARAACLRILAFSPDYPGCLLQIGLIDLQAGRYRDARKTIERLAELTNPSASGQAKALIDALQGRADPRAIALRLSALPLRSRLNAGSGNVFEDYQLAVLIMLLGQPDLAADFIDRISQAYGNDIDWGVVHPAMDPIRCQPRFKAVVARLKVRDPYAGRVCGGTVAAQP